MALDDDSRRLMEAETEGGERPPLAAGETDSSPDPTVEAPPVTGGPRPAHSDSPPASWVPPRELAEFRIERRLGRGGSADVWLARDTLLDRDVALKFSRKQSSPEARTRFRVEARVLARMRHVNLPTIHHVGDLDGRPFLVTEYLSGQSLDTLDLPIDEDQAIAIGIDLARGLSAAHRAGVLHRDIKPGNAFLTDEGVAKLLDFGIAQLRPEQATSESSAKLKGAAEASHSLTVTEVAVTMNRSIIGTPLYMAPETWRGQAPTVYTDVYSLGAVLFELLAGIAPSVSTFDESEFPSIEEIQRNVIRGRLGDLSELAPSVPPALTDLIARCLSVDSDARPTADELCDSLVRIAARRAARSEAPDDPAENPYRGLLAFGPEHRALFFGREAETAAVVAELRTSPFVLVAGASGAGKSSLVRAGVVPRVTREAKGRPLAVTVVVPGRNPVEVLASSVAPILGVDHATALRELCQNASWLADELRAAGKRLLIVLDQLEEVWTLADAASRNLFFESVLAISRSASNVRTVATLRDDFLARLEDMGELQVSALRTLFLLRPMTREGIRRAIVEPAEKRGVTLDLALVERLMEGVDGGSLPLLEFTLAELYAQRSIDARTIGTDALVRLGGVEGALATHADSVLASMSDSQRKEARRILLSLVTLDRTRARRFEHELLTGPFVSDGRAALSALVRARLLVASAEDRETVYEVAHEALLTGWPALRSWLDEEEGVRQKVERLRVAAKEWDDVGRREDALLSERRLDELRAGAPETTDALIRGFVEASDHAVRRSRRLRVLLAIGTPLLLLLLLAAAWALVSVRREVAIARAVGQAKQLRQEANESARSAAHVRAAAIALFEKEEVGPAEKLWAEMLSLEDAIDKKRRAVGVALDAALAEDRGSPTARALYADVIVDRLLAADKLHKRDLVRALRSNLELVDDGHVHEAELRAPSQVQVESDPVGARLLLSRYREDGGRSLVLGDEAPFPYGERHLLEPGSYLLVAELPGRYSTRYPFVVRRGEEVAIRVVLPPASSVPPGMLFVPTGRTLYGSPDEGDFRVLFQTHQPEHEVVVGAFLIARTEVTMGEYTTFVESLPEDERVKRYTHWLTPLPCGRIGWRFRDKLFKPGDLYCEAGGPCVDWAKLPVETVNREDAEAFAAWLSREGRPRGARLCTDREWERAARGADDRTFPSANSPPGPADACSLITYGTRRAAPCAAGTHPASASPFGVLDMTGSVWEWVAGTPDVAAPTQACLRGGSWNSEGAVLSIPNRAVGDLGGKFPEKGLRICADLR